MFSRDELNVIQKVKGGKNLSDEEKEILEEVQRKLDVENRKDVHASFMLRTGWANEPKDYPL